MNWQSDRLETIRELEHEAHSSGSFLTRAIVREIKNASARFSKTHSMWSEVVSLTLRWKEGMPETQVLEAMQRINRTSSGRAPAPDPIAT